MAPEQAKEEGRDTIKEYSEDFDKAVQQRFQMLRDLRDALEQNQLQLFLSDSADIASESILKEYLLNTRLKNVNYHAVDLSCFLN